MSTTTTAPKSNTPIVAVIIATAAAIISIVAVIAITLGPINAHAAPTTTTTTNTPSATVVTHHKHSHTTPTHHATPAQPSTSIELLQTQLAQLNYYNGQPTGYNNHNTVDAIRYLQRDAHLPQTGQLNPATQAALDHMLATGNNQMGS